MHRNQSQAPQPQKRFGGKKNLARTYLRLAGRKKKTLGGEEKKHTTHNLYVVFFSHGS